MAVVRGGSWSVKAEERRAQGHGSRAASAGAARTLAPPLDRVDESGAGVEASAAPRPRPRDGGGVLHLGDTAMRPRHGPDGPSIRPKRLGLAPRCSAEAGQSGGSVCSSGVIIDVRTEDDVALAFMTAWCACRDLGFSTVDQTKVATAVAELGSNIVRYAGAGTIVVRPIGGEPDVLEIIASDGGPGIADVEVVLRPGFRSRTGMGLGLKGVQRLMDAFHIASERGHGTTVTVRKARG